MTKVRILIVEDHRVIREMLVLFLEKQGFAVHATENGQQGLDWCLAHQPDLIITDNTMPLMTGLEMTTAIRAHSKVGTTRIILVSGDAMDIESAALAAGANAFLAKPYALDAVLHLIKKTLNDPPPEAS